MTALWVLAACSQGPNRPHPGDGDETGTTDTSPQTTDTDTTDTDTTPPTYWNGTTPPLQLHKLDPAVYPDALCPDGSPGAYYFGAGQGTGAQNWSVHLDFAESCMTVQDCLDASAKSISSDTLADEETFDGIFVRDPALNPAVWNWNHVLIFGCPRDRGVGNVGASPETSNLNFRGYAIIRDAMIELEAQGLGASGTILLHGSSGGGRAVYNSVDAVRDRYPAARVLGFADAAWDVDPDVFGFAEAHDQIALVSDFWELIDGQRDQSNCEEERQAAGEPKDWCYLDHYFAPTVESPMLFRRALYDSDTVREYIERNPDVSEADAEALIGQAFLDAFGGGRIKPGNAGFGPADKAHLGVATAEYYETEIQGDTVASLLADWINDVPRDYLLLDPLGP